MSFSADAPTLYFDVIPDEEGNLPESLKLYEGDCNGNLLEQTFIQTDSNGVQSIELNWHNLSNGQDYMIEIVQNSQNPAGTITTLFKNYGPGDPLDPPGPTLPECSNYMYNGSFEKDEMPQSNMILDQRIHFSSGYLLNDNFWNRADYYHTNGHSTYSPPNQNLGDNISPVNTNTGLDGYAGLFSVNTTHSGTVGEFREWMCGQLQRPMEAGKQYRISYYVRLSNKASYHDPCVPPGIMFSANPSTSNTQVDIVQMAADIQPQNILIDTTSWYKMEGIYTANGNEHYVTIANFLTNNQSDNRTGRHVSYFFVDAISIEPVDFGCCTSIEIPDGWDISDLAASPKFVPFINNSTLEGIDVRVSGTFTVNSNFTIDNVNFIMEEDAKIDVNNATFNIIDSELKTCEQVMWEGINVHGSNSKVTADNSTISDAYKGINAVNGGEFEITSSIFDANYYGIFVDSHSGPPQGTIENTTFKSSYILKDNSIATRPYAGIYLNDVANSTSSNDLTIGSVYNENIFIGPKTGNGNPPSSSTPGLQYGIIANKSSVNIYNNRFESFIKNTFLDPQDKSAIKIIGVPDNTSGYYVPIINIGGSFSIYQNDFVSVTSAVKSEDIVNLNITNNNIDFPNNQFPDYQTDYAISINDNVDDGPYAIINDIVVRNNDISGVVNGILLSNCSEQDIIHINGNNISLANSNGNTGIYATDINDVGNVTDYLVKYNTIQNATEGIILVNGAMPFLENNNINLNSAFSPSFGIRLVNTSSGFTWGASRKVKKNTINTQATTSNIQVYGISIESMYEIPIIECNTIKRTGTAIHFANVFAYSSYQIFGNEMENNYNAFVLSNNTELWNVGGSNKPSDNEWINSANYDTYTDGADGSQTNLFTRGGGLPYEPLSNGNAPSFNPINVNTSATGSLHDCDGGVIIEPGLMTTTTQDSLPDFESQYSSDTTEWIAKYQYYRSLPNDSLISNKTVQAFKDSVERAPLGRLLQIKASTNSRSSRISQLTSLAYNTVQESRLKTVIDHQLQAKSLNWDTLPAAVHSSLESIARECPFEAGPAVYEARNLLMGYTAKSYYNPCEGYSNTVKPATASKRMKFIDEDETDADESISIYPNPVKDELNINIQLEEGEVAEWSLQNIKGQLIQSGSLKNKGNAIDLSHLSQGVYFIQLKVDNQLKKTDKLIVQ